MKALNYAEANNHSVSYKKDLNFLLANIISSKYWYELSTDDQVIKQIKRDHDKFQDWKSLDIEIRRFNDQVIVVLTAKPKGMYYGQKVLTYDLVLSQPVDRAIKVETLIVSANDWNDNETILKLLKQKLLTYVDFNQLDLVFENQSSDAKTMIISAKPNGHYRGKTSIQVVLK